ncbi:MAG: cytochrome c [Myxococcales bacterium]|nr:cytochrome c [Myxococcales bacterium]
MRAPAIWSSRRSWLLASMLACSGCRGQTSHEPPIVPIRNMYNQPRYNPQAESPFFADRRTMRPHVEGTIAREMVIDAELATGVLSDHSGYVLQVPQAVPDALGGIKAMLERGEERFGIYCSPCHGLSGNGQGMIIKRGMLAPPSFHDPRIRTLPDGQIFATLSNGMGNMPPYQHSIPIYDRWAIVSYLRTLELAQAPRAVVQDSAVRATEEAAP